MFNKFVHLPLELRDMIIENTEDSNVIDPLKHYISYNFLMKKMRYNGNNILIKGDVQGGKTKEIESCMSILKGRKVLVIQNSLMVLKQYKERFRKNGIKFQIIKPNEEKITKEIIIVMANRHRYGRFMELNGNNPYTLILDEADQIVNRCPLKGTRTIYVTATPYNMSIKFDQIIKITRHKDYKGIEDLNINYTESIPIKEFLETETGIMLINRYTYVQDMRRIGQRLSRKSKGIPVVVLASERVMYMNGSIIRISRNKSISQIIDNLFNHKHIIFIANRLSYRGLSYVSSNYKRSITHQVTRIPLSLINFVQGLRILGIKQEKDLKLYLPILSNYQSKRMNEYRKEIE